MIPFSPPRIDDKTISEVTAALRSGWITTGPRVKEFEERIAAYCGIRNVLCVNSNSAGLELMLRWFGVGPGDEVIVPAYTYCATANVVVHCGATPVLVDVRPDFNVDVEAVRRAITPRTKVIMPVDVGGFPCDYDELNALVREPEVKRQFHPATEEQRTLGRILILEDAAHSIGASYRGRRIGSVTDIAVFSFHAVKNLTTAEGGAICLHLPEPFDNEQIYKYLRIKSLHGQSKDALAKTQIGNWRYDVSEAGYKCNMTDVLAAIGLVELQRYDSENLKRRREIFEAYHRAFSPYPQFQLPVFETAEKQSSLHLYLLRINNITENERDAVMERIFAKEVSVNVHYLPLPMLSFYRNSGYQMQNYPVAFDNYSREITLPVYYDLSPEDVNQVVEAVLSAVLQRS
ncbi:MAG: DegT/DnrJ/EryC1/StrS family aminotransferase [Bacteroidales bacterium]|nr:DegT/DnrJ/EryC1/StrS family aminotransferase [Bacteroidales bacterium]